MHCCTCNFQSPFLACDRCVNGYRQKYASSQAYEQSFPHSKRPQQTSYFESERPGSMQSSGEAAAGPVPTHSLADKVEQAKQKVKAQASSNLAPSSRLAAAVAGPIKAKKRKVRVVHIASSSLQQLP